MGVHAKNHASEHAPGADDQFLHAAQHGTGQPDQITPSAIGAEAAFSKNTAFNKNFGSLAGDVCQGNDARLSDARTPTAHAASHQNGGGDEISVSGLSGLLADPQTPDIHAASHATVGGDPISPGSIGAAPTPHTLEGAHHSLALLLASTLFGKNGAGVASAIAYTPEATGNAVLSRDVNGRAKVSEAALGTEIPTLAQVQALITAGVHWLAPVLVWKLVTDADGGGAPPALNEGEAAIVNNWGVGVYENSPDSFEDGDVAARVGAGGWNLVKKNVAGEVAAGTMLLVIGPTGGGVAAGSFAGLETRALQADGVGGYTDKTGARSADDEGETRMIYGEDAPQENGAVTYDWNGGVDADFNQTQSEVTAHNNTTGLQGGNGVDEFYHFTAAEHLSLQNQLPVINTLRPEVLAAGPMPVRADLLAAGYSPGDRGLVYGADGSLWWCSDDGVQGWAVGFGIMAPI